VPDYPLCILFLKYEIVLMIFNKEGGIFFKNKIAYFTSHFYNRLIDLIIRRRAKCQMIETNTDEI